MTPNSYLANVAHITASGNIFQVLNAAGTDWSEADTAKQYRAWQANTPGGAANSVTTVVANTVTAPTANTVTTPTANTVTTALK